MCVFVTNERDRKIKKERKKQKKKEVPRAKGEAQAKLIELASILTTTTAAAELTLIKKIKKN